MMSSSSNRLLNLFQLELKEGSLSSVSRAPSHGADVNPVKHDSWRQKRTREGVSLERRKFVFPFEAHGEVGYAAAGAGTNSRVKTKLETENELLREQLKFQGAVLDQLSGEVYKLERIAAAGNGGHNDTGDESKRHEQDANERVEDQPNKELEGAVRGRDEDVPERPLVEGVRHESRGACEGRHHPRDGPPEHNPSLDDDAGGPSEDNSVTTRASASACNQAGRRGGPLDDHTNMQPEPLLVATGEQLSPPEQGVLQRPLQKSPPGKVENEEPLPVESAQLRSELREARGLAEKFRGELSAAQKMAQEKNLSHVNLLARERKFRAAVEAGLREKVHIMRRRARDREERLSAELSSVRAQLRETVDLLATKEEEACAARTGWVRQEEIAAATLAKNKEREQHATWLERRLEEVSSVEAAAAALRLEEMTAVLESQQRELELLRASTRPVPRTREQQHQHQQEENQREIAHEENRPRISPLIRTCFDECASTVKDGKRSGNLESDLNEREQTGHSAGGFAAGCSKRTTDRHSAADNDTDRARTASDGGGTPVSGAKNDNSPAGPAATGRSTRDLNTDPHENGDPAPQLNRDDADYKRHSSSSAFFNASPTMPMTMTMTTRLSPQTSKPAPGLQREGEGQGQGKGRGVEAGGATAEPLPVMAQARTLEREDSPLSTKETEPGDRRIFEMDAGCGHTGRQDETNGEGGLGSTRAAVGTEAELLVRLRRCEEESREWEKEAMHLRVERRGVLLRLRMLGREMEDKDQAISGLRQALSAMESDLKDCRGGRIGLQQKLRYQAQARRVLEKRAKSAEDQLSDAVARKTKAERAKLLLKARLMAVTKGKCKSKGGETSNIGRDQAASRQAFDPRGSTHGCPLCSGSNRGTATPARNEGIQRGGGTTGVGVHETRQAGDAEARERPLDSAEPSLSSAEQNQQQQPREQEHETRLDVEAALKSEDSGVSTLQLGQRPAGPPGRHHHHPKMGAQRNSLGKERQESKNMLEGQNKTQLELVEEEEEREWRKFEAERQRLEREWQRSSEAAQHAEMRVREMETAWQALAGMVVALAERNADLEWVILQLRREGGGHRNQESQGNVVSSEHTTREQNGLSDDNDDGDDDDDDDGDGKDENEKNNGANADVHDDGVVRVEDVPRATLDVEALFDCQQAAQPVGGGWGGGVVKGAEERPRDGCSSEVDGGDDSDEG